MTERDPSSSPDREQRDRLLGPKSWVALIGAVLVFGTILFVVVSVLTSQPSSDPNAEEDFVAISFAEQPDPNAPSRYAELAEALRRYQEKFELIEQEFAHDRSKSGSGVRFLDFHSVLKEPDPTGPESYTYEEQVRAAEDARRATATIIERNIFSEVTALLRSPNLARTLEDVQNGPYYRFEMYAWHFNEAMDLRKLAHTAIGCARVLTERGETQRAADLLNDIAPIPAVLTTQAKRSDHSQAYIIANWIAQEVEHLLVHTAPDQQTLNTLRSVQSHLSRTGDLTPAIEGVRVGARDLHYLTHTLGGRFIPSVNPFRDSPSGPENGTVLKLKDSWGFVAVRQRESMQIVDELLTMFDEANNELDPVKRDRLLTAYDEKMDSFGWQYPLIHAFPWPSVSYTKWFYEHETRITVLGFLLAMAEYRLDTGDWPESLNQLIPAYLESIPTNPLTGQPFTYDHEPGQQPSLERLGEVNSMPEHIQ